MNAFADVNGMHALDNRPVICETTGALQEGRGSRRLALTRRIVRGAFVAACVALLLLFIIPFSPHLVSDGLDASWQAALHVAFQQGLNFGSQLIFTYGPLGFAHTRTYWPGLYALTLLIWLAVGAAFVTAALAATQRSAHPVLGIGLITLLACAAAIFVVDAVAMSRP